MKLQNPANRITLNRKCGALHHSHNNINLGSFLAISFWVGVPWGQSKNYLHYHLTLSSKCPMMHVEDIGGVGMMNQSMYLIKTNDSFISTIAKCLSDAVGDDIRQDIKLHRLVTQNSTPSRIWDLINTNICERFAKSDVIANPSKRGGWELVPVFERNSDTIYSLMREQRFETLKKQLPKRRTAHYVDALVRSLNKDLRAPQRQATLFPLDPIGFSNENHIQEIV